MSMQPVSIRQPEIGALVAGRMTALIRPIGRLAPLRTGDLLWVREPFHLHRRFDHDKPTRAAALDAVPTFVADHKPAYFAANCDELGRRRVAREMPKQWHRQHLRISALDRVQLHDVADDDLRDAGWADFERFRLRWDADATFVGSRLAKLQMWTANPLVLRIAFVRIAAPLPAAPEPEPVMSPADAGLKPDRAAEPMRRLPARDRTPCPRCGIRRDRGCEHFPLSAQEPTNAS